jgi:hypothetical protein
MSAVFAKDNPTAPELALLLDTWSTPPMEYCPSDAWFNVNYMAHYSAMHE